MIVYLTKIEKECNSKLQGIYDIEGYEGILIKPYKKYIYNLNQNHTYRLDFTDKVLFWENGEICDLPLEFR